MKYYLLMALLALSIAWRVNRDDQFIIDSDGLRRVFHGVNVVYKVSPFYPPILDSFDASSSLSDEDLDNLVKWGQNFIRLYVAWEGVEPVRDQYNYEYLAVLSSIIKRCEKKGITVLLDAHQDVLSRFFCGNGIPDWAISRSQFTFPFPVITDIRVDENGVPVLEDCLKLKFAIYYFSTDVSKSFSDLFHNKDGIADQFAKLWGVVANYFKDDHPNLIGYEIMNEPLPGTLYDNVYELLYPNVGNNRNLLPLYRKVSEQIRKYDQQRLLFFEPGTTDLFGAGFNDSPGGFEYRDREVFSYHIYCYYVDNHSVPKSTQVCAAMDTFFFESKENVAKTLGIGKFLTEFGAIVDSPGGNRELNWLLSLMEQKFTSWAYWEFKFYMDVTTQAHPGNIESYYDENGKLYTNKVKTLARPYATKICGDPLQSFFEPKESSVHYFTLSWKASKQCNGKNTEVFLSREFYYKNFYTQFKNCAGCKLHATSKSYYDVILPNDFVEGTQIELLIYQLAGP